MRLYYYLKCSGALLGLGYPDENSEGEEHEENMARQVR